MSNNWRALKKQRWDEARVKRRAMICPTCNDSGLVVVDQSWGNPYGEQIQCPEPRHDASVHDDCASGQCDACAAEYEAEMKRMHRQHTPPEASS